MWHFYRASDSRKLERLQERGLRVVYNEKQASYLQLLERAKLPNLMNRRLQDIFILMYKVKYKLCPSNICNIFKEHIYGDLTKSLRPIRISFPRWVELFIDKNTSECREICRIVSENFLFI